MRKILESISIRLCYLYVTSYMHFGENGFSDEWAKIILRTCLSKTCHDRKIFFNVLKTLRCRMIKVAHGALELGMYRYDVVGQLVRLPEINLSGKNFIFLGQEKLS